VRRSAFERVGGFMELARGADTIFVQRVIAEYSCRAVQYRPDVVIDHLEVKTAATWFHKMNTYGRSSRRYSTIVPTRPLNAGERLRIWRGTIRNRRYSVMRSTFLLVLLAVGVVCFEVGRLSPVPHR
jgi:hypothetical protein